MLGFVGNMRISLKLPIVIAIVSMISVAISTIATVNSSGKTIRLEAEEKLESISNYQARRVGALLNEIDRDIMLRAASAEIADAVVEFSQAFMSFENPQETLQKVLHFGQPPSVG